MSRHRFHSTICLVMVAILAHAATGQTQSDRRRQFVQGLLKTFIESQLPDEKTPAAASQPRREATRHAPQIREATRLLTQASDEMSLLVGALQADIYRAQGVRQLLSLAMSVNADAAVLARRLARAHDVESLREPLRNLDQNWRTLEYRLSQTDNLSANTLGHIERIRQYETRLAEMFGVQTQVDLAAILEHATQMRMSLRNLLEDIRFEIPDASQANQLLQDGRDTWDYLQLFLQTTRSNPSYEDLKQDWNRVETEWVRYERRLRGVNNRFIQRQSQRLTDSTRQIHSLLYLSAGQIDRENLIHVTRLLQRDVDQLLRRVNLKMLSELPAARRFAIDAAADVATSCQDLLDVLEAGDSLDIVSDLYLFTYDEWQRLSLALQGITSQQARQSIRDIEESLGELRSALGIQLDFDRSQATELAAAILSDARHFQEDMRDFFGRPNRYSRAFQTESLQAAAQFHASARQLYSGLSNGEKLRTLKSECANMSAAWNALNQFVPRLEPAEQARLQRTRRQLTPQVIEMQTLLSI